MREMKTSTTNRSFKHGYASEKIGYCSIYNTWTGMRERCHNPRNQMFPRYGGRGIKVCERWMKFSNFLADMGPKPPGGRAVSIDRIDNNGDYEPENCRWTTAKQQARNRSNNTFLSLDELTMTQGEWELRLGLSKGTIYHRIKAGWSLERALTAPKIIGTRKRNK